MKKIVAISLVILVLCISGCVTGGGEGKNYSEMAREKEFSYFFPSTSGNWNFATLEDAYDYVRTAQMKFSSASGKNKVKTGTAKLSGPAIKMDQPVRVQYRMGANNANGDSLFSGRSVEAAVKEAISANLVFLVFHDDRSVLIPNIHLQNNYRYSTGAAKYDYFTIDNNRYETDYPPAWDLEKAFRYLRKEIN